MGMHVVKYDFGPKTPEEEVIFAREAARVDREVRLHSEWLAGSYTARVKLFFVTLPEKVEEWVYFRFRSVKFFYQRLTRGWDDSVTWSLDDHLAKLILPRLKRFKELNKHAYPGKFPGIDRPDAVESFEEWQEVLNKMIFAFEWHADDDRKYGKFDEAEYEKVKEGLQLFATFYGALWD